MCIRDRHNSAKYFWDNNTKTVEGVRTAKAVHENAKRLGIDCLLYTSILVTGFDPFGGEPINPAIESVKLLPATIEGAEIIKLEIPTVVHKSLQVIREAIQTVSYTHLYSKLRHLY